MRIAVVGGGLAGCAAALELARLGNAVVVHEARPTLGGAVQTLPARDGDPSPPPDNGQHIALGCFTEYVAFLTEVGAAGSLRRSRLRLPVADESGRWSEITPLAIALRRYRHLPFRDRAAITALVKLRTLDARAHDDVSFGDLLLGLGQTERALDRFWDVFVRPALNLRCREVSAAMGIFTVQRGLLAGRRASDVLLPTVPLGDMHGRAVRAALEDRGVTVETNSRVDDLDGLDADGLVVAVPPKESALLLGEPEPALEDSPIVSVHLLFDRPILRYPLAALLASDAHWIFDHGALTGHAPPSGQYLTVVSSGVPELMELRGRELVGRLAGQLTDRLGPADLVWSRVSREPRATVALRPGTAVQRPGPATPRPNVTRAGAWTGTGWPATMESAVRSGRAAARLLTGATTRAAA
ncbi:MAG TPA: hydroxysqualene dehydroxylase HpnE [Gaiellaceae bacterium]